MSAQEEQEGEELPHWDGQAPLASAEAGYSSPRPITPVDPQNIPQPGQSGFEDGRLRRSSEGGFTVHDNALFSDSFRIDEVTEENRDVAR
eukprot:306908-Prorocentrum_minimum.AAC.3